MYRCVDYYLTISVQFVKKPVHKLFIYSVSASGRRLLLAHPVLSVLYGICSYTLSFTPSISDCVCKLWSSLSMTLFTFVKESLAHRKVYIFEIKFYKTVINTIVHYTRTRNLFHLIIIRNTSQIYLLISYLEFHQLMM